MTRAAYCVVSLVGVGFCLILIYGRDSAKSPTSVINVRDDMTTRNYDEVHGIINESDWSSHKLAVVIPFRDALEELVQLIPHLHEFLNRQRIRHRFLVVHQTDIFRFNKGCLVNIGYLLSKSDCDYMVIHDVDLLPLNSQLNYSFPSQGPFHIASPEYHPFYHGSTYIGGIILLTMKQFGKVRGMTNKIWGWGGEDNELYMRIIHENMTIYRPSGLSTGTKDTFKNLHDVRKRPRDKERFKTEHENVFKVDSATGFFNVQYKMKSTVNITVAGAPFTMYNIELHCDETITKWCSFDA